MKSTNPNPGFIFFQHPKFEDGSHNEWVWIIIARKGREIRWQKHVIPRVYGVFTNLRRRRITLDLPLLGELTLYW